jgi:putative tryptophan/tyrosine transport system substrate-binding protein
MNKKVLIGVLVLIVLALGAYALWGKDDQVAPKSDKMVRVGISQITSHPVMDMIYEGLKDGFKKAGYEEGKNIEFDVQNAQGEASANSAIAQKFATGNYDIIIPFGTNSSQAVVNLIKDKPVVFSAVTDPVSAGLVSSKENPGANVTGTSDITLYKEHLEFLKQLKPDVKTIGVVYNPGEANAKFALDETKKIAQTMGLEIVTAPANNSGEIMSAARSLVSKVDAFYMMPDNTVLSGMESIVTVANEAKKPFISVDQSGVEKGALATLGTNYRMVGERTAEMAVRILKGEKPGSISVLGVTDADIFVNEKTANAIGITIPQDILQKAKQVYR